MKNKKHISFDLEIKFKMAIVALSEEDHQPEREHIIKFPNQEIDLCVPSENYIQLISLLIGLKLDGSIGKPLAKIAGIVNVASGIWRELGELLPSGVGAYLYDMPRPINKGVTNQDDLWDTDSAITDWRMYGEFYVGCELFIVCEKDDTLKIIEEAAKIGLGARQVGVIIESAKKEIIINSNLKQGGTLSSLHPELTRPKE